MATDRDEQLRQQQELEEIRRSFAEMGARMGSLFEPAEADEEDQPSPAPTADRPAQPPATIGAGRTLAIPTAPPTPAAPPASGIATWPRWWLVGAVVLLLLAGTALGWLLPRDNGGGEAAATSPQATAPASRAPAPAVPAATQIRTRTSVPESCLETAQLGDEVIARLNRNIRDNRLSLALRDYTIASQACRKEASP
jgi:hypothetical protein